MHPLEPDSLEDKRLREARAALKEAKRIAVPTSAGVGTASGLATFRGAGGLPRSYRAAELATPKAYRRDPQLVWAWYYERFAQPRWPL